MWRGPAAATHRFRYCTRNHQEGADIIHPDQKKKKKKGERGLMTDSLPQAPAPAPSLLPDIPVGTSKKRKVRRSGKQKQRYEGVSRR